MLAVEIFFVGFLLGAVCALALVFWLDSDDDDDGGTPLCAEPSPR